MVYQKKLYIVALAFISLVVTFWHAFSFENKAKDLFSNSENILVGYKDNQIDKLIAQIYTQSLNSHGFRAAIKKNQYDTADELITTISSNKVAIQVISLFELLQFNNRYSKDHIYYLDNWRFNFPNYDLYAAAASTLPNGVNLADPLDFSNFHNKMIYGKRSTSHYLEDFINPNPQDFKFSSPSISYETPVYSDRLVPIFNSVILSEEQFRVINRVSGELNYNVLKLLWNQLQGGVNITTILENWAESQPAS